MSDGSRFARRDAPRMTKNNPRIHKKRGDMLRADAGSRCTFMISGSIATPSPTELTTIPREAKLSFILLVKTAKKI